MLTSVQMARFVADGFLRFDEIVPAQVNEAAVAEFESEAVDRHSGYAPGRSLYSMWPQSRGVGAFVRTPAVREIVTSLLGAAPTYDHHAIHIVGPRHGRAQNWHGDAIIDTRMAFDVQLMWFPRDTTPQMGGTMILPGSHFRRISESDIARYHNFAGQLRTVCKAGTVLALHHGMWHCAQPNLTDETRYMFKVRMNPTVRQLRLWDTSDLDDPSIPQILQTNHGWYGNEYRLEQVNRVKLWRYLTGDASFDVMAWLTRLENQATV